MPPALTNLPWDDVLALAAIAGVYVVSSAARRRSRRSKRRRAVRDLGRGLVVLSEQVALYGGGRYSVSYGDVSCAVEVVVAWTDGSFSSFARDGDPDLAVALEAVARTLSAERTYVRSDAGRRRARGRHDQRDGSPLPSDHWTAVLGLDPTAGWDDVVAAHRRLTMRHHPDRGGDTGSMAAVNAARDRAREELGHVTAG